MNAQSVMADARLVHVRELRSEVDRLKAENARLRDENEEFRHHFDLAVLAAEDLRTLAQDAKFIIVDGWNQILAADRTAKTPDDLIAQAKAHLAEHPDDFVWIVFDGPRENARVEGRLRISYTGGTGAHRADRFICDFLRMARFCGDLGRIEVRTHDRDFRRDVARLLAGRA